MDAFSGYDYVSSFFGKGKTVVWTTKLKRADYVDYVGVSLKSTLSTIEKFVCTLYGNQRVESVDVSVLKFLILASYHPARPTCI